jgi:site-specific recombinase
MDNEVKTEDPNHLAGLIHQLRNAWALKRSKRNFDGILETILSDPKEKELLADQVYTILSGTKYVSLLTESEIGSNRGFFSDASARLAYKFLPPINEPYELQTQFGYLFTEDRDYHWVRAITDKNWVGFFRDVFRKQDPLLLEYVEKEVLNSILILAQRAASLGIEPEIVTRIPRIDDLDSPFLGLNREVIMYVEKTLNDPLYSQQDHENDFRHILVMIKQCNVEIGYIYKHKDVFGISLRMTYIVRQLEQLLKRLAQLLELMETRDEDRRWLIITQLFKEFVYAENTKFSLRKHFSVNLQLLTYKVVENTSKTGENYIASSMAAYWKLFFKALGGGVIVGLLCCNKTRLYFAHFPIFWEAFFYSMNYSLGFMLIHILGFTIATKQPAMTASTIAASLSNNGQNPDWLYDSTQTLIKLIRSQFISLVGNASVAFPVAFGLDWLYFYLHGHHIADTSKALKLIAELNPWESLAIPHAAIAGVYLMLSGLVSGYYENKWIYHKYTMRISNHPELIGLFGRKRLARITAYFEKNYGGLAGNFALGVFLGCTSALGAVLGLPLDIRHITFASGNFGIAVASLPNHIPSDYLVNSIIGICAIGVMNVLVSFGLSIAFALKSRNAKFSEARSLLGRLAWQFFHHPAAFFFPVKEGSAKDEQTQEQHIEV